MREDFWKEEYEVGCDYVDAAHRKLFAVMGKVSALIRGRDYEKEKFACVEAIKFLYNYTDTHFKQEEAFMRQIGYEHYEDHKLLHDNLRNVTLPALDAELEANDYSPESIHQFIGIFAGWLTGHILIEDRAITGRAQSKWNVHNDKDREDALNSELKKFMSDFHKLDINLITRRYEGLEIENAFYYEMIFKGRRVVFFAQNAVVLKMASDILGSEQNILNKQAMMAYVQLIHSLVKVVLCIVGYAGDMTIISHRAINPEILKGYFGQNFPDYSLEWGSQVGRLGLCVM